MMDEITRTEKFLRACIDGEPCALKPLTRVEKLLAELNDKLAGGSSEVVILPETVVTVEDGDNTADIMSPLSATPTEGATAKVTYNGTEYPCTVARVEEDGMNGYAMGNLDAMGLSGGNPDAPFVVILFPDGMEGAYGGVMPVEGVTSITLSIVQEGSASAGGGMFVVKSIDAILEDTVDGKMTYTLTLDKSYNAAVAAVMQGRQPVVLDITDLFDGASFLRLPACGVLNGVLSFSMYISGATYLCEYAPDGTATLKLG